MPDASTIARTDVSNRKTPLCKAAMVDRDKLFLRKLSTTNEGVHKELIIYALYVQVRGDSACREQSA